jgi:hypothetical protein
MLSPHRAQLQLGDGRRKPDVIAGVVLAFFYSGALTISIESQGPLMIR